MLSTVATASFIVSLLAAGLAGIFYATDRASATTRALSLCLLAIALAVFAGSQFGIGTRSSAAELTVALVEVLAILAGVEWGRRIGNTAAAGRMRSAANALFRAAQILVLVYAGLRVGYVLLFPDLALAPTAGLVPVRGFEFAIFVPVLGAGMLCAAIALLMLLLMRIDSAEKMRLRALLWSGPFLLAGLVLGESLIPATLTLGLLIVLAGSVRYLMLQGQRGEFMRQFLSPEVAREVKAGRFEQLLKRERRPLSVLVCDLRGFTAFARTRDSDAVAGLLERFYAVVGTVTAQFSGTVKDHAGDGVLILVGAPLPLKDHAARAVQLARELRVQVAALLREADGELGVGLGIATGRATVGTADGAGRLEYVAVGNVVNLAARLCARAEDGEILLDSRTRAALDDPLWERLAARPPEMLKGFAEPVAVYALSTEQQAG
jgi:adenylate cyclase